MKGGERSSHKKSAMEEFEDMVLKWTLDDIMNENLFANKVKYIPERFMSVKEYLGSFIWPVIEEMRAELQQCLESISQAPHLTVTIMKEIQSSEREVKMYEMLIGNENDLIKRQQKMLIDSESDSGKTQQKMLIDSENDSGKTQQKHQNFKPKDILILSTQVPNDHKDFHDDYLLALVCSTDDLQTSCTHCEQTCMDCLKENVKVKLYVRHGHPFTWKSNNMRNKYYAIYLSNMITSLRIWNALHRYFEDPEADLAILPKAIHASTEDYSEAFPEEKDDIEKFRNIHFMSHSMNDSQASAVIQAVNAVENKQNSFIKLIQGPPGTGKTSMLIPLISALIHKGSKLLVCAPTNAAISEVAMRFLKVVTNPSGHCPNTSNFPCIINLSDIVLLGNEERFDPDGPLGDIFLTYRIQRLVNCFLPVTGWRHTLTSLTDFLESADLQYENVKETIEAGSIDFAQYIRERLKILTTAFYECAGTILHDLPGTCSKKHELEYLIGAVESFVNLIEKDNVNERVLRECFVCGGEAMQAVANCSGRLNENMYGNKKQVKKFLCSKRNECIALLRNQLHSGMNIAQSYVSPETMERLCLSKAKLVFSTVISSGKRCMGMAAPFECLIIDEAAQLKESESTISLQISGLRHAILIGDPNQLPATVISKISKKAGYGRSLFERLRDLGYPVHLLNTQYRMHPFISRFPNMEFYENRIIDGPNVKKQTYGNAYIESEMYGNYAFINVKDGKEEEDDFGRSKKNVIEAAVVLHILSKLYKVCASREGFKISVGVISPYTAQVLYLKNKIMMKNDEWGNTLDIEVKSVDGFQGGEKDMIIISTVRTENIGFLSDCRRANVAITRARFFLWIVGNGYMFMRSTSIWEKITKDAIARECFIDPRIDDEIGKVIRHAKAELDQLQDLLNKDSVVFNNTKWKVIFSNEFKASFTKIKGLSVRQQVINTILKLANGWRWTRKQGGSGSASLINEYATSGLNLVWTTDVERGEDAIQILKIWNVLSLAEVPRLRKRLENVFVIYTPEYIERCKARFIDRDGKTVPKQWKDDPAFVWYKSCRESQMAANVHCEAFGMESITVEHARVDESLLLMKFYSLSSRIANQLLTAQNGSEIDLLFEVNDEESQIIRFPRSLFVLGRSGTGKTTVLTYRLLQKEQQLYLATHGLSWENNSEFQEVERMASRRHLHQDCENGSLRQLFVTVSPKLCSAIKNHIRRIDSFVQGKDHSPGIAMLDDNDSLMDFQNIPDSFIDIGYKHFPMVITFHKFLMMLDGSISCQFFKNRCSEEQEGCQIKKKQLCSNVKTEEDSIESVYNCKDLDDGGEDNDILDDQSFCISTKENTHGRSLAFMEILKKNEVTYEQFDSVYWPHFNSYLRRGLESSVVFTEIISHLKGSLKSINSPDFRMSRDAYIAMSENRISTLSLNQREAIYDLFLLYEKQKQRSGNFDIADVVNHLHQQLQLNGYSGVKMHFIYVDEVQDLSMAQIALFKYVCSNISEGFLFAGDTAQTIARGINFRFEDIRNLFYEEFLAVDDNDQSKAKIMPDLFHLTQNFRTHTGITKLAQSVVDVLYHFFPFSIDKLHPETSLIYGEPPIVLDSMQDKKLFTTIFGHGEGIGNGKHEFGAEQAILVRDDCHKVQILEQVGKQCLVLTILECKGLEFQDVLLYNFFSMSPVGTKWRAIYGFMDHKGYNSEQTQYPMFDNTKHNILCSELKRLYVAITRAKQRLWIYEENPQYATPMVDYWKKMGIIQSRCLDRALVETMYVASNSEDWKQKGIQMFNEKNYDMAIVCFERAGEVNMTKWAKAAGLREGGKRYLEINKKDSEYSLKKAAEIFLEIEKPESAARCYIILGDYRKAGRIYEEKCGESHLQDAGDCFAEAKLWYEAASAYARTNCVSKCLNACLKGKLFETGLNLMKDFKREVCNSNCGTCQSCETVKIESDYLKKCATHYHQKKDTESMMRFVKAFPEMVSIRSFLSRKDYFDELLKLEVASGNFQEAAEVAAIKGDLLREADMLEKAERYNSSVKSILLYVRANSFWGLGNNGGPMQMFNAKHQLRERLKSKVDENQYHVHQTLDYEIPILLDKSHSLQELTETMILAGKTKNVSLEVLSIKKVLDVHLHSNIETFQIQHDQGSGFFRRTDNTKMLLEHRISSETMLFLWSAWKEKLKSSADALSKLEKRRERKEDIIYIEFAFEYFGVRMNKNQRFCTVFNSEASWLEGRKLELTQTEGSIGQISIQNFSKHAKDFLLMDLLSVGKEVIKKLEERYNFCQNQLCMLTVKANLILQMYQISKDMELIESEQTGLYGIENLEEHFFDIIFPLMRQYKNFKEFLCVCEETRSNGNIFEDIAKTILPRNCKDVTLRRIGRLQVLLPFLLKDQVREYGKKVIERLPEEHYWNNELLWLGMYMPTDITMEDKRKIVDSLGTALTRTFYDWTSPNDYISPHVFVLLLEKLLFLSSSCHLSESLLLPCSFFVEFMTGEQGNVSCTWLLQAKRMQHCKETMETIYNSICDMVFKLLVTHKMVTFKWIGASKMDKTIFPEFALRLIIVLCLIYVNSRGLFKNAGAILSKIFEDKQIVWALPSKFKGKIPQMLGYYQNLHTFIVHFSRAMKNIDNPLVLIEFGDLSDCTINCEDAIFLGQESIETKETVLQTVFQEKIDTFVLSRSEDTKCKENMMVNEKEILSPSSNNSISNSEHVAESVKAEENVPDNLECAGDGPKYGKVSSTSKCISGNDSEQKKDDSVGIHTRIRDENIQISPDEGNEPCYKLKIDGQYVSWFVLWRMKRWVSCARKRLEEQLPMKDKYIQEAREVFQGTKNSFYTEIFISKACALKAEVDEFLYQIETTIPKMIQGKVCSDEESCILDQMHDVHEQLITFSELLHPRHPKHARCDINWLENDAIAHTCMKLEESKSILKPIFEVDSKNLIDDRQASPSSSKQNKKNRPKRNKKGGKRKK